MGFKKTQKEHDKTESGTIDYWINLKEALEQAINGNVLTVENIEVIKKHIKTLEVAIKFESGNDKK